MPCPDKPRVDNQHIPRRIIMDIIVVRIANFFEKLLFIPRKLRLIPVVAIGLSILTSMAATSESTWGLITRAVAALAWVGGIVILILAYGLTVVDKKIEHYDPLAQMATGMTICCLVALIIAPIPILTIVMAIAVGRPAGIATGSCLAILYWYQLLPRIFPEFKFWDPWECASS